MVCKPVLVLQTIGLEAETEPDFIIPVSLQLAECLARGNPSVNVGNYIHSPNTHYIPSTPHEFFSFYLYNKLRQVGVVITNPISLIGKRNLAQGHSGCWSKARIQTWARQIP